MGVTSSRGTCEGGFLHRHRRFGACIPKKNLPAIRTAENQRRMKRREFSGKNIGGAVEGVFRPGMKMHVPDLKKTRRVLWRRGVLSIRC